MIRRRTEKALPGEDLWETIWRLFAGEGHAPSRIDRELGLREGTAHDEVASVWQTTAWDGYDRLAKIARRKRGER